MNLKESDGVSKGNKTIYINFERGQDNCSGKDYRTKHFQWTKVNPKQIYYKIAKKKNFFLKKCFQMKWFLNPCLTLQYRFQANIKPKAGKTSKKKARKGGN